jgi:hypothetical protein
MFSPRWKFVENGNASGPSIGADAPGAVMPGTLIAHQVFPWKHETIAGNGPSSLRRSEFR